MGINFYLFYSSAYALSAGPDWRVSCFPVVELDDHLPYNFLQNMFTSVLNIQVACYSETPIRLRDITARKHHNQNINRHG